MHDVAVIGAGLSGLSAARHLAQSGLDVVVLEKSRGLGGRAATRRIEWPGPGGKNLIFDHGAQFFTARDPVFRQQVEEWISAGICFEWATGFHTWDGVSLKPPDKQWEAPRYACHQGMSALGKDLGTGLLIRRDFRVGSVIGDRNGWLLSPAESSPGEAIQARAVFSSAPVPQSLELLGEHFSEEDRDLMGNMTYGRCLVCMANFENMPAIPDWRAIQVRDPGSSLSWMAWDSSKRNPDTPRGSFVLHASPEFSAGQELSAVEAQEQAQKVMLQDAAAIVGSWFVTPSFTTRHLWRYAIPLGPGLPAGFLNTQCVHPLYLVGDGVNGGRIEGAWLSGRRAAEHFLKRFEAA